MNVSWEWLAIIRSYLPIIASLAQILGQFSDMDGFQDGGYIWAQGVLSNHLIKVPWIIQTNIETEIN